MESRNLVQRVWTSIYPLPNLSIQRRMKILAAANHIFQTLAAPLLYEVSNQNGVHTTLLKLVIE
jgi:hypothetical protein